MLSFSVNPHRSSFLGKCSLHFGPMPNNSTPPPTPCSVLLAIFCQPDSGCDLPPVFDPRPSRVPSAVLDLPSSIPREAEHTKMFRQQPHKRNASTPVIKQGESKNQGMDKRLPSSFQQLEKIGQMSSLQWDLGIAQLGRGICTSTTSPMLSRRRQDYDRETSLEKRSARIIRYSVSSHITFHRRWGLSPSVKLGCLSKIWYLHPPFLSSFVFQTL